MNLVHIHERASTYVLVWRHDILTPPSKLLPLCIILEGNPSQQPSHWSSRRVRRDQKQIPQISRHKTRANGKWITVKERQELHQKKGLGWIFLGL